LRAKGAGRVVELLLDDDAVSPARAAKLARLSDRAARRLFDRLIALGAARELSGRPNFRLYGL
jgi:predicted ArsR family transcriptional regulator